MLLLILPDSSVNAFPKISRHYFLQSFNRKDITQPPISSQEFPIYFVSSTFILLYIHFGAVLFRPDLPLSARDGVRYRIDSFQQLFHPRVYRTVAFQSHRPTDFCDGTRDP